MEKQSFNSNQLYGYLPTDIDGVATLAKLALDMRWSWNHAADELWQQLDPELWDMTNNPWILLQKMSRDKLKEQLDDVSFREKMNKLTKLKEAATSSPAWFQKNYPNSKLTCVAYFSMEFMLSEALPIYVGGLGNVAGDQLKSASDLGVPVVAVGLLYSQGYFRQEIDQYGTQQAIFPYNDPGQLPITPLRLPNGDWLRLKVTLSGFPVWLRTWQVQVGNVKLFLLDSNDAANLPSHREITNELYGGGPELRIQQEIILGIGGYKLLRALDIKPEVCHMNEGHAAFLVLERANDFMKETGCTFENALAVTRAGNLFTTHTAVAAGFDYFSPSLMEQFLGGYAEEELKITFNDLMALGRIYPGNYSESFNMANLAFRGSGAVNGVSSLHGQVSRHLFETLFPRWPTTDVPVGSVTNGVHMPSWDSAIADTVWSNAGGKDRWRGDLTMLEQDIYNTSDELLWQMRNTSRNNLVDYTRKKYVRQLTVSGQSPELIEVAKSVFDPNVLTLGFARRFVPYKIPDLLLHNEERLIRLLTNHEHPVQLVIAGKSPPFDEAGKNLIRKWVQFIQRNNLHKHVVFLSDYDMALTQHLVTGVDVWLNTPRRPWEACGTSGMKVLVNGGINLSELDGWWAEAYTPEVGWAIGDGHEHGDDPAWDAEEANELYDLLEQQVIPQFYNRDKNGIPVSWVERVRKSMATLTPAFSANRTVREYTEKYYLPAAVNYIKRAAKKGVSGTKITGIQHELLNKWGDIKFGEVKTENIPGGYRFQLQVSLNGIDETSVSLQLYANGIKGAAPEITVMKPVKGTITDQGNNYEVKVITTRPAGDYTARVLPCYENIAVPLEDNHILWQS
jgi:starch phosphorylase